MRKTNNWGLLVALADLARRAGRAEVQHGQPPVSERTKEWRATNGVSVLPWEEPIQELWWIEQCRRALDVLEQSVIRRIKREGGRWEDIGAAFEISKQAAQQRWRHVRLGSATDDIEVMVADQQLGAIDTYLASLPSAVALADTPPTTALKRPQRADPPQDARRAAQFERVRQLHRDGQSVASIAALLGLATSTVYRYLAIQERPVSPLPQQRSGSQPIREKPLPPTPLFEHVHTLAAVGRSIDDIMAETGLSRTTVRRYLMAEGEDRLLGAVL